MLAASWATKVWQLIVLQGVLCGLSGAVLYTPVLLWLNGWFHMKRGLATGIIFSGESTSDIRDFFRSTPGLQLPSLHPFCAPVLMQMLQVLEWAALFSPS